MLSSFVDPGRVRVSHSTYENVKHKCSFYSYLPLGPTLSSSSPATKVNQLKSDKPI